MPHGQELCNAVFTASRWRCGEQSREQYRRAVTALILTFQVGRAVHISADAIHTYSTEVHPEYKDQLPADLLELIYFLDEDLGHWLLFIPYYSTLALLTYCHAGD